MDTSPAVHAASWKSILTGMCRVLSERLMIPPGMSRSKVSLMPRHRHEFSSAVRKLCLPSSHHAPGTDEYHTAALSRVFLVHVMPIDESAEAARAAVSSSSF